MADYIDKNDLREYISGYIKTCNGEPTYTDIDAMVGIISLLEQMPDADVQPVKRGYWINVTGDDYECSECKAAVWSRPANPIENYHYCWRCGAKMDDAKPIKG